MNTSITLEESLLTKFMTAENPLGLGKVIYNELTNETLITNGKTLITYADTKLEESLNVNDADRLRITNLANTLIHKNFGEMIACELYFSKEDARCLLGYIENYSCDKLKLTFNNDLSVVLASSVHNPTLVKILQPMQINTHKHLDMKSTAETEQIYNVLKLMYEQMSEDSVLGIALQHFNRPILVATENLSACISCIKE